MAHIGLFYTFSEDNAMKKYERIRELREDRDITQQAIANYLTISQRAYSHYEDGSRSIPVEILDRLASYYNTSVDYMINRTDRKEPY